MSYVNSKPDTEIVVEQRRATHLTTWTRFHMQLNPDETVLPLKVDSMLTIVKKMREVGYEATRNYLATMKRAHIKGDWPRPGSLSVAYRDAARTAIGTLGSTKKAKSFAMRRMVSAYRAGAWQNIQTQIMNPIIVITLAALCLPRTIEAGDMRCQDIVLSGLARWAALKVTASTTGIAG